LANNNNNNNSNGEDDDFKKMLEGFENLKTENTKAVSELRQRLLAQKNPQDIQQKEMLEKYFLSLPPEKQQEIMKAKNHYNEIYLSYVERQCKALSSKLYRERNKKFNEAMEPLLQAHSKNTRKQKINAALAATVERSSRNVLKKTKADERKFLEVLRISGENTRKGESSVAKTTAKIQHLLPTRLELEAPPVRLAIEAPPTPPLIDTGDEPPAPIDTEDIDEFCQGAEEIRRRRYDDDDDEDDDAMDTSGGGGTGGDNNAGSSAPANNTSGGSGSSGGSGNNRNDNTRRVLQHYEDCFRGIRKTERLLESFPKKLAELVFDGNTECINVFLKAVELSRFNENTDGTHCCILPKGETGPTSQCHNHPTKSTQEFLLGFCQQHTQELLK